MLGAIGDLGGLNITYYRFCVFGFFPGVGMEGFGVFTLVADVLDEATVSNQSRPRLGRGFHYPLQTHPESS